MKIKKIAPEWLVSRAEIVNQKKKLLLEMARKSESKPKQTTKLGSALGVYTNPKNETHDPVFTKKIRKIAPQWFDSSSEMNKRRLLAMAERGEKRPVAGNTMGNVFRNYTTADNTCYDSEFTKKIRRIAPHWLISRSQQNKQTLLTMAKKGEPRPAFGHTKIGSCLFGYISKKSGTYDPDFTREIRRIAPDWIVSRSEVMLRNKQLLIDMAKKNQPRPNSVKTKIGALLSNYTNPNSKTHDPAFTRKIRKLAPHWLVSRSQIADQKKRLLLEMADKGESKPKSGTKLDNTLFSYLRKDSSSHDPDFARAIKKLRPDWFVSKSKVADQKKKQLLILARKGESRPKKQKHPLGIVLGAYTRESSDSYDPQFTKQIKKLAPQWFKKRAS